MAPKPAPRPVGTRTRAPAVSWSQSPSQGPPTPRAATMGVLFTPPELLSVVHLLPFQCSMESSAGTAPTSLTQMSLVELIAMWGA